VILGPSTPHAGKGAAKSLATDAVTETLMRCRSAQRRFRNTLLFVVADEVLLATAREVIRKAMAWQSICEDKRLQDQLTRAQIDDTKEKAKTSRDGAAKADIALEHSGPAEAPTAPSGSATGSPAGEAVAPGQSPGSDTGGAQSGKPRRFYGSVELDPTRPVKAFDAVLNAVVMELQRTQGAKVKITLEIEAEGKPRAASKRPTSASSATTLAS